MNTTTPPPPPAFTLARNPHGRLVLTFADGTAHEGVTPVRAFPIAAPTQGLALLGQDGHELLWIARLDQLAAPVRAQIEQALALREFVPVIEKILTVSSFATPSTWEVETDRGLTRLVLKAEEDIRRLGARTQLLIASGDGLQFCIEDSTALDRHSRRLLERFL
ncbi:cyanophycin metabolism-associated DUF1854 family protein [Verminephrobacter eiseniae]|uniref:cyanophycin metabolism-associated DUF1854 family protein n=1 Tax=Verminephrobacter eiseniae TaxID=364317 RepID=UPI002238EA8B|nr:DUF1854 domain-containing protein [Verminephrobacter eiseniae]MCW5232818.1 DUF1854 domain-containing protein [Verminephrobacter eiseniae]MCW5295617.1 DUF1854 domain-containing protein [Verminephrobacter eiseniae]MCW8186443.1 DUF1854 domain-containing protein [Verminephrobacter eiseniae]MCW8226155.1 DUF1854 domain-containing protein [Verminephrobacter eiseniae]MCW8237170.1 DUF1854 domain-containing protein [Verminephrobacter eiseniae]